ncbi:MAG TPA: ATP-binding protein [Bacteroidales bacterium]|nr:ATP-binding protein [Bacteroidales bacterium]
MKKNITKRIFFAAAVFLFLIILNFFYKEYVLDFQIRKETLLKNVEEQIKRKEKIAGNILDHLILDSTSGFTQKIFIKENLLQISEDEAITFLKYKNDTLVFWTDNFFSSPELFNEKRPDKSIVKTDNGWYYLIRKKSDNKTCWAAVLIKHDYKYENDYLENHFCKGIKVNIDGAGISGNTAENFIRNSDNQKIFSLTFGDESVYSPAQQSIIVIFYFLGLIIFVYLLCLIYRLLYQKRRLGKTAYVLFFTATVVMLRAILFYLKQPAALYSTDLFGPLFYASSGFLPSFGDLLINTVLFFILSIFIYKNISVNSIRVNNQYLQLFFLAVIISFLAVSFLFIISTIQSVVLDSTISYNLSQLFTLSGLSIVGLLIISLLVLSYFLVATVLLKLCSGFRIHILIAIAIIIFNGVLWAVTDYFGLICPVLSAACFVLFSILYLLLRKLNKHKYFYYEILAFLIVFTFTIYYTVNKSNSGKEIEKRKSFAHKLSSGEDPLAENIFKDVRKQIIDDQLLLKKLSAYPDNENEIKEYLTKKYFSGYWDKYKVQITVCNPLDSLVVEAGSQTENCIMFFDNLEKSYGKPSSCKNLMMLNYGTGGNNYLSRLDFVIDSSNLYLFIELNSKFIPKGLGYLELLIDKKLFLDTDLSDYSYAKYFRNDLIDAYGNYYYSTYYSFDTSAFLNNTYIFNRNGYNHLCYQPEKSSVVVISKKNGNILDILAPFSILFTLFSVVVLIFYLFEFMLPNMKTIQFNFKNRLQVFMVSIILISIFIIGISTIYFIRNLNENKNLDLLSEKSMSVLIELQSKIGDTEHLNEEQMTFLNSALIKFSNVFFTDINIFDDEGKLISSSRPQIFSEGLLSDRINPLAYYQLLTQKKTLFIHKEHIGKLNYYSSYVPFYDRSHKVLYYINLPYFAKEGELNRELSSFMSAFINIYVIIIAITTLIALFVAGHITRPLNVIRTKLRNIKLGKKNEKIVWTGRDEIGGLISEYNRMIDELAESAEILSRSERESAWRVMAMQVAHEIKNPLTPMKLSVQHLERSWKDNAPDWKEKLEHFTKNIVEQIDNLSAIASEFSYFAQMPKPENERIKITELVANSISIFMSNRDITISFDKENAPAGCVVFADKKQLIRVMNNILTNAIQAIGDKKSGLIEIGIGKKVNSVVITVKDNGAGISDEMKPKIFTPNFSTKSEGMGLGLAIVKGIIENSHGKIWFDSGQDAGTTFYIELPLVDDNAE